MLMIALAVTAITLPQDDTTPRRERPPVKIQLTEVAASVGLDHVSLSGEPEKPRLPDQLGQGMAWFDYDGDGWLDLFVPNGATLEQWRDPDAPNEFTDHLYRNRGDGTFEDVTEVAGVGSGRWGAGVAVGDLDSDGDPDIYVCNFGPNQTWENQGDGTFVDVSDKVGAVFSEMTPGAGLGDLDLDGDLDLYVSRYIFFDPHDPTPPFAKRVRDIMVAVGPVVLPPAPDRAFRNDAGVFTDVTKEWGLLPDAGRGFTVVITDMTGDDIPDVFVACDESPNVFYRGLGGGTLEDEADISGLAVNRHGKEDGCMGIGISAINSDLYPDFYVTNFFGEQNAMYVSSGVGIWDHRTDRMEQERSLSSRPYVGWGVGFFDLDLDADEDILMVNGHIHPRLDDEVPVFTGYGERPVILRTESARMSYTEVTDEAGSDFATPHSARGAAFADYDEDGDIDVAITNVDGPIRLFRNDTESPYGYFRVLLEGADGVNADAYGSRVTVVTGRKHQHRWIVPQSSYLCHNDARAHFGVLARSEVDEIRIRWTGGREEVVTGPFAVNQTVVIRTGEGVVAKVPRGQPMPGWKARLAARANGADDATEGDDD